MNVDHVDSSAVWLFPLSSRIRDSWRMEMRREGMQRQKNLSLKFTARIKNEINKKSRDKKKIWSENTFDVEAK